MVSRLAPAVLLAVLVCASQPSWGQDAWRAAAEEEIATIAARSGTLYVENLNLADDRDGLWRGGEEVTREFGPAELSQLRGDRHTLSFGKVDGLVLRNCRLSASVVTEALKFSACRNVVVEDCLIIGGKEDALDIVRGANFYFRRVTFLARGEYAVTIKAGVRHVRFIDCGFRGRPSSGVFVDLGNWSDYDVRKRPPTADVAFTSSCVFEEWPGRKITPVRILHAEPPVLAGKVAQIPQPLVNAFFLLRRWQDGDVVRKKYSRDELEAEFSSALPR